MNVRSRIRQSMHGLAAVICLASVQPAAAESLPNDANSLGARWWQLAMSIPTPVNPLLDDTGKLCMIGQQGSTWFLNTAAGPLGDPAHATCTIPEGVPILVPLFVVLCNPSPGETIQDNIAICKAEADAVDIRRLRIDGKIRNGLIQRRARRSPFPITVPADNLFGFPAGVFDSVHDGHFALIPPLARGTHVVRAVGGRSVDGLGFDVIYRLHIVRPRQHVPLP
jgi:hypothetical protein